MMKSYLKAHWLSEVLSRDIQQILFPLWNFGEAMHSKLRFHLGLSVLCACPVTQKTNMSSGQPHFVTVPHTWRPCLGILECFFRGGGVG